MAEIEPTVVDPPTSGENPKQEPSSAATDSLSFCIWPPSDRTRDAVVRRLVETLTNDTVLSKRYGAVPAEEAELSAQSIEKEAFEAAEEQWGSKSRSASVEEGIETLQVYSKEVSRRMLEFAKGRSENASPASEIESDI